MAMCSSHDIWSSLMDSRVDHECRRIQQSVLSASNHLALLVDMDEVRPLDEGEGKSKRVHPESIRLDRVANSDVPGYALIESVFAKDAECCCQTALEIFPLFLFVLEFWWTAFVSHF